jgi:phage tail-like protein
MRRAAIERLLPSAYQRASVPGSVLRALIDVMETLHAPDERILADSDELVAPYRTPDAFPAYLLHWVAMDHVLAAPTREAADALPVGRLRDLVAEGAMLARWRGTPYGLRRALRLATGVSGFVIDEPADRPFHLVVRTPQTAAGQVALIARIVEAEKPASTTFEVVVDKALPAEAAIEEEPGSDS